MLNVHGKGASNKSKAYSCAPTVIISDSLLKLIKLITVSFILSYLASLIFVVVNTAKHEQPLCQLERYAINPGYEFNMSIL